MPPPDPDASPTADADEGLDADLILAGGGLANGLIAWRLRQRHPGLRVRLIEAGPALGGNHTWSFHDSDPNPSQKAWLAPLVAHRWSGHSVRFEGRTRQLRGGYCSITSERFDAVLREALGDAVELNQPVAAVTPTTVRLGDGRLLRARAVIDGRGLEPMPALQLAYQKFVGLELRLERPHGLDGPILMDATVRQHDGYRFVYTLPLDPQRLLIEDTCYADGPVLEAEAMHARVLAYARDQGWRVAEVLREERGVLPIAIDGDIDAFWASRRGQPCSGLRAALFHPTTGYSLGQAMRLADAIADHLDEAPALQADRLAAAIEAHARAAWRSQAFFRGLNRMLFLAAQPLERHRVLAHFYRLPDGLVERFYGERLGAADRLRILVGKPPVPVHRALRVLCPPRWMRRAPSASAPAA